MTAVDLSTSGAPPKAPAPPRRALARERLLSALAGLWLLDGLLQLQPYMFTKDFASQTIAATALGNPAWVASPVNWAATLIRDHPVGLNTLFAFAQLALGLGIAYRPTRRLALAGSIAWAASVWYLGEGLGGLFAGTADPLTGAPGSASLYLLLAVLLWPGAARGERAPFPAAGLLTARAAKGVWTVLWAGLAALTLTPANRAPGAFSDAITGMTGEPAWYARLSGHVVSLVGGRDLAVAVILALVLGAIPACVWLPERYTRAGIAAALVLCAVYWVVGQAFGMPFMGMSTDPNSGPVLAVIALAYWPVREAGGPRAASAAQTASVAVPGPGAEPEPGAERAAAGAEEAA